ncbi:MAG: FAD binding domain-containing protein, partial [Candidatus Limnocylindria bacterium]
MKRFEVVQAGNVEDCLRALAAHGPEAKLLAGGTDLLPQLKNGLLSPRYVVDLSRVARLRTIDLDGGRGLRVGAAVTARELELDQGVRTRYAALAESGALVGSVQVRNLATVGGNLCNAAPSADMAPPLLALEAEAVIAGPRGERRVPLSAFFTDVRRTVLAPDELLLELVMPAPPLRSGGNFLRHTPRRELDIAVVGVHDSETGLYRCYLEKELPELWPVLERIDILVGYNSDHFDIPLLNKYYPGELGK